MSFNLPFFNNDEEEQPGYQQQLSQQGLLQPALADVPPLTTENYPSRAQWRYGFPSSSLPGEDAFQLNAVNYLGNVGDTDYEAPPDTGYEWAGPDNEFQTSLALTSKQRRAQRAAKTATRNNERVLRRLGGYEDYLDEVKADEEGGLMSGLFDALNVIPQTQTGFVSEMLRTGSPWEGFKQAVAEYAAVFPGIEKDGGFIQALTGGKTARMAGKGWGNLLEEENIVPAGMMNFAAGLVLDIALDPTSYTVLGGAGKLAKAGSTAAKLAKAGRAVEMVTPIGMAGRLGRAGLKAKPVHEALYSERAIKFREKLFEKDLGLRQTELGQHYLALRKIMENLTDRRVALLEQATSGILSQADPFQKRIIGLFLNHPDGINRLDSELEKLVVAGRIPESRLQYLKDSVRDIRGFYNEFLISDRTHGVLDKGQMTPNYAPQMGPVTDESAALTEDLMVALGIKPQDEAKAGFFRGPSEADRVAAHAKAKKFPSVYDRITSGIPTELDATHQLVQRGYASVRAQGTKELMDRMKLSVEEGGIGAREVSVDALPPGIADLDHLENSVRKRGEGLVRLYKGPKTVGALIVPKEIADDLKKANNFFADPEVIGSFLKYFDKAQSIWKAHAILTPGFHVRNSISNKFNMWLAGMGFRDQYHRQKDAFKIASGTEQPSYWINRGFRELSHVVPEVRQTRYIPGKTPAYGEARAGMEAKAGEFVQADGSMMPPGQFRALTSLLGQRGLDPEQVAATVDMMEMIGRQMAHDKSTWRKQMTPQQFWDATISGIHGDDPEVIDSINRIMNGGNFDLPGGGMRGTELRDPNIVRSAEAPQEGRGVGPSLGTEEGPGTPADMQAKFRGEMEGGGQIPKRPMAGGWKSDDLQTPDIRSAERPPERGGVGPGNYLLQRSHEAFPPDFRPDEALMNATKDDFEVSTVTPPSNTVKKKGFWNIQGQHSFRPESGRDDWERWVTRYSDERWDEITQGEHPDNIIRHFADNLKYLFETSRQELGDEFIESARNWYRGANANAQALAKAYGISVPQATAIIAVLSPQKQWDDNVSQAWRLVDMIRGVDAHTVKFDDEMAAKIKNLVEEVIDDETGLATGEKLRVADKESIAALHGKTLADVMHDPRRRYQWIRAYDAAKNDQMVKTVLTDGRFLAKPVGVVKWQSTTAVSKVFDLLADGSLETISEKLGGGQKVRNFYNNILVPNSDRYVTIDTHAGAAAHLIPFAASSREIDKLFKSVPQNGGAGVAEHYITRALYPVYAEAYALAAKELGLLPRELQSITWEAIRGMYPDFMKKEKDLATLGLDKAVYDAFRETQALVIGRSQKTGKLKGVLDNGSMISTKEVWRPIRGLSPEQRQEAAHGIREILRERSSTYFTLRPNKAGEMGVGHSGGFRYPGWYKADFDQYDRSWVSFDATGVRGVELGTGVPGGKNRGGNVGRRAGNISRGGGVTKLAQRGNAAAPFGDDGLKLFGDEIDDSTRDYLHPTEQQMWDDYVLENKNRDGWAKAAEANEDFQDAFQQNLVRVGVPDNVILYRGRPKNRPAPQGPYVNAAFSESWAQSFRKAYNIPESEWVVDRIEVPRSSIVAPGHPQETEVIVRRRDILAQRGKEGVGGRGVTIKKTANAKDPEARHMTGTSAEYGVFVDNRQVASMRGLGDGDWVFVDMDGNRLRTVWGFARAKEAATNMFGKASGEIIGQEGVGGGINAAVEFLDDARAKINLFRGTNVTSLIHEYAHVARRQLDDKTQNILARMYGTDPKAWTEEAEERWARDFERYLYDGGRTTAGGRMGEVFAEMKRGFGRVYSDLDNSPIANQISGETREGIDKIFGKGYRFADELLMDGKDMDTRIIWDKAWRKLGIEVPEHRVGKPLTVAEARDLQQMVGVTGHGFTHKEIARGMQREALDGINMTRREYRRNVRESTEKALKASAEGDPRQALDQYTLGMMRAEAAGMSLGAWEKSKDMGAELLKKAGDNPLTRLNRTVGNLVEDLDHSALWLHGMSQGMNPMEAAGRVNRYLFDYNNLTDLERNVFRRLIPFYAWMRFNIPLQFHAMFNDPGRYAMVPKVINEIQAQSPDWEDLPTPDYFDEAAATRLNFMRNGKPMYILPGLPYVDINKVPRLGTGMMEEATRDFMSGVGPIPKMIYGALSNQDPYFNRPIEAYPGELPADSLLGKKNQWYLGVASPLYQRSQGAASAYERGDIGPWLLSQMGLKVVPSDIQRVMRGQTYGRLKISKELRDKWEARAARKREEENEE